MKIKSINHITYNTNHRRDSSPSEIHKETLNFFESKFQEAQKHGAELLDDTILKLTIESDRTYAATLFSKNNLPIFTTCGTKNPKKVKYVWDNLRKVNDSMIGATKITPLPSKAPFCVDLILPPMIDNMGVTSWTGDFSKCLAWAVLSPESII